MNKKYVLILIILLTFIGCGKKEKLKEPLFSIEEGVYKEPQKVYLNHSEGIVFYTLDESNPTPKGFSSSNKRFNSNNPIEIGFGETVIIKAVATKNKYIPSEIVTKKIEVRETLPILLSNFDNIEKTINKPFPIKVFYREAKFRNEDIEIRYEKIGDTQVEVTSSSPLYKNDILLEGEGKHSFKFRAFSKSNKYFESEEKELTIELKYSKVVEKYSSSNKQEKKIIEAKKIYGTIYDENYVATVYDEKNKFILGEMKKDEKSYSIFIKTDEIGNQKITKIFTYENPRELSFYKDSIMASYKNYLVLISKENAVVEEVISLDFNLETIKIIDDEILISGLDKNGNMVLKKYDDNFKLINERTFNNTGFDIPKEIFKVEDYYYLILETDSIEYNTEQIDVVILKLNKNLEDISFEVIKGNYNEYFNSSFHYKDKIYLLVTTTSDLLINKKGDFRAVLFEYDLESDIISFQDTSFVKKNERGEDIKVVKDIIYLLTSVDSNVINLNSKSIINNELTKLNTYKNFDNGSKALVINNHNTVDIFYTSNQKVEKAIGKKDIISINQILQ